MSNDNMLMFMVRELYDSLPNEVKRDIDMFSWYRMEEFIKKDPIAALLTILVVVGIRYIEPLIMLKKSEIDLEKLLENKFRVRLIVFKNIEYENHLRKLIDDKETLRLISMYTDIIENKIMLGKLIARIKDSFWRKYLEQILIGHEGG